MAYKLGVVSGLGAVIAIVAALSIFMPWLAETAFGLTDGISGWSIFAENVYRDFEYYFMPIVIAAMGIFAMLIFLFAPKGNVTVALLVILGIAIIGLSYFTFMEFEEFIEAIPLIDMTATWGLYVTMAAGAGTLVCGAVARE